MAQLVIEHVPISDLKEWSENPRYHNVEAIRRSMERFGIRWPIIVNRNTMQVEAGHGRLKALRELGQTEVPVLFVEDDDLTAKAFAIADNRTQELTEWDEAGLADVLTELQAEGELEPTAFSIDDLNELLRKLGRFDGETFDVEAAMAAAPDQVANTKRGDIWQLGRHRLMCGDSTEFEDVATLLNGERVALLLTDPPYNVGYRPEEAPTGLRRRIVNPISLPDGLPADQQSPDQFKSFLRAFLENVKSFLAPQFSYYICWGIDPLPYLLDALKQTGYKRSSVIIWDKGQPVLGRKDYHSQYELMLYGWLQGHPSYFVRDRTLTDIWYVRRDVAPIDYQHPTTKPIELAARAMHNSSRPGDVVCDLFVGSGWAIIAAEQTGRICYGMEIVPYYCDVAIARWEAYTGEQAVLVEQREMAYA